MDGNHRRQLEWMPESFFRKPDWRLRRAEYLLETGGRLDRRIDDVLVKSARTEIAKVLAQDRKTPARLSVIQSVHALSKLDHATMRWRLEAYLLTDLTFHEIGGVLGLSPAFVSMYHDLAFDVRSRPKATDWLARFAMSRASSPDFEQVLKVCARAGGPKLLEATIAIATGASFPNWVQDSFANPAFDDAVLRMRGLLTIGVMLARTREQWRALVALRRKLRRLLRVREDTDEKRLMLMTLQMVKFAPDGRTSGAESPLLNQARADDPEPCSWQAPAEAQSSTGTVAAKRREEVQADTSTGGNQVELHPEIVEFKEQSAKTGPLAFLHINLEEEDEKTWSADGNASEPQVATLSIHVGG